jgi:hypothetical protein
VTGYNETSANISDNNQCQRGGGSVATNNGGLEVRKGSCGLTRLHIFVIKPTICTNFSNFILEMKLYMFLTVPLSIIRSYSPAARKLSTNLYDIYHCCVYGEKLLMMDKGIV